MTPTIVPAHFVAKDMMSKTFAQMKASANSFAKEASRNIANAGQSAFQTGRQFAVMSAAVIAPMALAAKSAVDFEAKMSNVSTLIDTSKESIDSIGNSVLILSKKLPVPIDELTTSLYDIRSAGIAAKDQFNALEAASKLSVAGLATAEEGTNILTSAMNAFASEGLSASEISDMLFKTVKYGKTTISQLAQAFGASAPIIQSAGVQLADMQAATAALTTVGTPASQAQNQLRASIIALQKPTKEMDMVFRRLGVKTGSELIKKYGSMGDAFIAVNGQLEAMNLNAGKAWGSTEALAAVTSLTTSTNKAYVTTLNDMRNGSNALNEAFDKQSKTSKSQMQMMRNNLQSLSITLGQALLPIINDLVKEITPFLKGLADWATRNKSIVKTIAKVALVVGGLTATISAVSFVVGGFQKAFAIAKVAMMAFNAVAAMNPLMIWVTAGAAIGAGIYAVTKAFKSLNWQQELNNEVQSRALEASLDQRIEAQNLFNDLRKLKTGTDEYRATLQKIEQIQPGITEKYKLQAGAIRDINAAEKELIGNIMKRAEIEARAEIAKEKQKEAIRKREGGAETDTWAQWSARLLGAGESVDKWKELEARSLTNQATSLTSKNIKAQDELDASLSPAEPAGKRMMELILNVNGLPAGSTAEVNGKKANVNTSGQMPALFSNL